jgi:signal-transduction protein with cAMP-binding, CBS, and nucleotidyltransferase domain
MRVYRNAGMMVALAATLVVMSLTVAAAYAPDYKFKVHNNTKQDIKKILVSEDGKKWGYFNIGDGIKAGETEELVWDKSTDKESCEQWFKAVFSDDAESEPVKFDFCEKDLVLEFN